MFAQRVSLVALSFLPFVALPAQEPVEASQTKEAKDQEAGALDFYRAFYIERRQLRFDQAISLYQKFIAAHPEHAKAAEAAQSTARLLDRVGRSKDAGEFRKTHAKLLAKAEQGRQFGGDAAGQDRGQDRGQGRGQGGRRGGFGRMFPNLAEMSDDEAKEAVGNLTDRMRRMVDRMAEGGMEDEADAMEVTLVELETLVDDGKKDEAQKILDKMQEDMRARFRGRGQGGGQGRGDGGEGGGRRRGGDEPKPEPKPKPEKKDK